MVSQALLGVLCAVDKISIHVHLSKLELDERKSRYSSRNGCASRLARATGGPTKADELTARLAWSGCTGSDVASSVAAKEEGER